MALRRLDVTERRIPIPPDAAAHAELLIQRQAQSREAIELDAFMRGLALGLGIALEDVERIDTDESVIVLRGEASDAD